MIMRLKRLGVATAGGLRFGTWVWMISLHRSWKSISAEGNRMHNSTEAGEEMSHNQEGL